MTTCHGHSPAGQSSPSTIRIVPDLSMVPELIKFGIGAGSWLLMSLDQNRSSVSRMFFCSVEFAVLFSFGGFTFSMFRSPDSTSDRRTLLLTRTPHLKGSARVCWMFRAQEVWTGSEKMLWCLKLWFAILLPEIFLSSYVCVHWSHSLLFYWWSDENNNLPVQKSNASRTSVGSSSCCWPQLCLGLKDHHVHWR